MVACPSCKQKYRIKSAHFERLLHTGPRTLDEADSVLRSDSVDIDPDEVSPVSIDDEGNVVGLSGLSELMRWSDEQSKQAAASHGSAAGQDPQEVLKARLAAEHEPARAMPSAAIPGSTIEIEPDPISAARIRARRSKRKRKQTPVLILTATLGVIVGGGLVILLLGGIPGFGPNSGDDADNAQQDPQQPNGPGSGLGSGSAGTNNSGSLGTTNPAGTSENPRATTDQDNNPSDPADEPADPDSVADVPDPDTTTDPDDPSVVVGDALPKGPPEVLDAAKRIEQEGWYFLNPPRAPSKPNTEAEVSLKGTLAPGPGPEGQVVLSGEVQNRSEQSIERAEVHVMLMDAQGYVFAETYVPMIAVNAKTDRKVSVAIADHHWKRTKSMRTGVQVLNWADPFVLMPDVKANPIGEAAGLAVRVSAKHEGEKAIRSAMFHLRGLDLRGVEVAEFLVPSQLILVDPGDWLDVLIPTPIGADLSVSSWSVDVYAR